MFKGIVLWRNDQGQAITEYAVILAAILLLVFGTVRLVGTNARTMFSNAASSLTGSDSE